MGSVDIRTGEGLPPSREETWRRIAELAVRLNEQILAQRAPRRKKKAA